MTTDSRGRIKLGPVESGIVSIVAGVIALGIPALIAVLWSWQGEMAINSTKIDSIDRRVERIENRLESKP